MKSKLKSVINFVSKKRIIFFPCLILIVVISIFLINYFSRPIILDLYITNLTSNSVSVVWITDKMSDGSILFYKSNNENIFKKFGIGVHKAYDDRDIVEISENNYRVKKINKYYIHQVTLKGLSSEETYKFFVKSGWNNLSFKYEPFTTYSLNDEIKTPYPIYGKVIFDGNFIKDQSVVVNAQLISPQYVSQKLSTTANSSNGWSLDISNVYVDNMTEIFDTNVEFSLKLEAIYSDQVSSKIIAKNKFQPTVDIKINNLISSIKGDKINSVSAYSSNDEEYVYIEDDYDEVEDTKINGWHGEDDYCIAGDSYYCEQNNYDSCNLNEECYLGCSKGVCLKPTTGGNACMNGNLYYCDDINDQSTCDIAQDCNGLGCTEEQCNKANIISSDIFEEAGKYCVGDYLRNCTSQTECDGGELCTYGCVPVSNRDDYCKEEIFPVDPLKWDGKGYYCRDNDLWYCNPSNKFDDNCEDGFDDGCCLYEDCEGYCKYEKEGRNDHCESLELGQITEEKVCLSDGNVSICDSRGDCQVSDICSNGCIEVENGDDICIPIAQGGGGQVGQEGLPVDCRYKSSEELVIGETKLEDTCIGGFSSLAQNEGEECEIKSGFDNCVFGYKCELKFNFYLGRDSYYCVKDQNLINAFEGVPQSETTGDVCSEFSYYNTIYTNDSVETQIFDYLLDTTNFEHLSENYDSFNFTMFEDTDGKSKYCERLWNKDSNIVTINCWEGFMNYNDYEKCRLLVHELEHANQLISFKDSQKNNDGTCDSFVSERTQSQADNDQNCRTIITEIGAEQRSGNSGGYVFVRNTTEKIDLNLPAGFYCGTDMYEFVSSQVPDDIENDFWSGCEPAYLEVKNSGYDICSDVLYTIRNQAAYYGNFENPGPCRKDNLKVGLNPSDDTSNSSIKIDRVYAEEIKDKNDSGYYIINSQEYYASFPYINIKDGQEISFYEDINQDGMQQPDEPEISEEKVNLEKMYDTSEYYLKEGWNMIGIPFDLYYKNNKVDTAQMFLQTLNLNGIIATQLASYDEGKWIIATRRNDVEFSEDFPIFPGRGYFIKVQDASVIEFTGTLIKEKFVYNLSIGWNLISVESSDLTASLFLEDISKNDNYYSDVLSKWDSGKYENFIMENDLNYGNDFNLFNKSGYFVRVKSK